MGLATPRRRSKRPRSTATTSDEGAVQVRMVVSVNTHGGELATDVASVSLVDSATELELDVSNLAAGEEVRSRAE